MNPSTALARELLASYDTGQLFGEPPSTRDPNFDMPSAYAVEAEFRRLRLESGRTVTGRKVGFANKAMQRVLKLETLVWASMYDDTTHDGATELSLGHFMAPRIEPEIVFKLKRPMSGTLDAAAALACVDWMAVGFEIIDCPFPGWQFKPVDFVAAYGLHRALVIGPHHPVDGTLAESLATFKLKLFRNGQLADEGGGKNSLRSPALCLAELARAANGLESGELISTGTLTGAQPVAQGETWFTDLEVLPLERLELRFLAYPSR
jgi:2-oxo-3-hexenedioate decarboxylase